MNEPWASSTPIWWIGKPPVSGIDQVTVHVTQCVPREHLVGSLIVSALRAHARERSDKGQKEGEVPRKAD